MPIPEPKSDETQQEFVARCISSDIMQKEFSPQKRKAICYQRWEDYVNNIANNLNISHNNKYDPTGTLTLRRNFRRKFSKKSRKIRGIVRKNVFDNDIFGFSDPTKYPKLSRNIDTTYPGEIGSLPANKRAEKFANWLSKIQKQIMMEGEVNAAGDLIQKTKWWNKYVDSSYIKGLKDSAKILRKNGIDVAEIDPGKFLKQPQFRGNLKSLNKATEQYIIDAWADTSDQVKDHIQKRFIKGYVKDQSVTDFKQEMTQIINDRIDKIGYNRSRVIAHTEIVRAHNEARLDYFDNQSIANVTIKAEYSTAFDSRVCPVCESWEGETMTIQEARGLIPMHPLCYDNKTEVYTKEGWKLFKDLKKDDKIFSMNPENLEVDFLDYKRKVQYEHKGKMYHLTTNSLDLMTTPDHSQIIGTRNNPNDRSEKKYRLESMDKVVERSEFFIPRTGDWRGKKKDFININGLKIDTNSFVKFMGYYLSEGSVTKRDSNYQISIHQSQPNKDKMYNDIKDMPVKVNNNGRKKIYLFNNKLGQYLMQFGHSNEKYVPNKIKELDSDSINKFINAYGLGDGTVRTDCWEEKGLHSKDQLIITTSSKKMADDLGELILKSGYYPSFKVEKRKGKQQQFNNGTYTINNNQYIIRRNRSKNAAYSRSSNSGIEINKIDYNGFVYDVELPKWHVLWVRRNGKTVWSGNCRCVYLPIVNKNNL